MEDTLFDKTLTSITGNYIRSYKHKLFNISQRKIALNPFDNKRYILNDGIHTLGLGHYRTT